MKEKIIRPLGLVSVSFRDRGAEQILAAARAAGLSCIEWGSDVHAPAEDAENASRLAKLQKEYGVRCCSYGTYFRLGETDLSALPAYFETAKTLGTNVLRLWCGNRNSAEYTAPEKERLFAACRAAAAAAARRDAVLCMECHNHTFTDTKESALELMRAVGSPAFRMYWQPRQDRTERENLACAALLAPYTVHLHVFNWKGKEKYPLRGAVGIWRAYLQSFAPGTPLLLEFMPDGKIESLPAEAEALKEIAE